MNPLETVFEYHEETKHHYHRFARSLGYLDWDTQPDPFRRFLGCELIRLKLLSQQQTPLYEELFQQSRVSPVELTFEALSRFFRNSLALSAWKRYQQAHWSLRVNPSSGNLHPTEGYVILGDSIPQIPSGIYHYAPREHALENRAQISAAAFESLTKGFPAGTFFVGLTSIHWREAWKYGERAFRYCQHDIGHAIACLRLSAAVLGWNLILLEELSDEEIAGLLGLNRTKDFDGVEVEHPDMVAAVFPKGVDLAPDVSVSKQSIGSIAASAWHGKANQLSSDHVEWKIIEDVASATSKLPTSILHPPYSNQNQPYETLSSYGAEQIIQQRRSAVAMDGVTSIPRRIFYKMMLRVLPADSTIPFDTFRRSALQQPRIHLGLFVNRVDDLASGLYFLVRDPEKLSLLRGSMDPGFAWSTPPDCPEQLPLYCLKTGEFHQHASSVSCGQDIAGDGAFSLGMIAEFKEPLQTIGPWFYRRLFWESGFIGQLLYLEAEAAGIRSTGIGCYFDDPVHGLFGFRGNAFQSLYHFTVGGPVEDLRLTTEEPYGDHSVGTEFSQEIELK